MSWFSELAGKAENILNKLDSEVSTALSKENKSEKISRLSKIDHKRTSSSSSLPNSGSLPVAELGYSPSQSLSNSFHGQDNERKPLSIATDKEQSLMNFLNNESIEDPIVQSSSKEVHKDNLSQSTKDHSRQSSISSMSSFMAVSGLFSSKAPFDVESNSRGSNNSDQYVKVEDPIMTSSYSVISNESEVSLRDSAELQAEVSLLRKELQSLNQEMIQAVKRAKSAEKELQIQKEKFSTFSLQQKQSEGLLMEMNEKETKLTVSLKEKDGLLKKLENQLKSERSKLKERENVCKELTEQNQRLLQGQDSASHLHTEITRSLQQKLTDLEADLLKEKETSALIRSEGQQRTLQLENDLRALSKELNQAEEKSQRDRSKIASLNNQITSLKKDLTLSSDELTQYKAKAGRILVSKDELIASLKEGHGLTEKETAYPEELEQLREERDLLREELRKCQEKVQSLSFEVSRVDEDLQQKSREVIAKETTLLEDLKKERSEVSVIKEELCQAKEELKTLQEDTTRQKISLLTRIQERDDEVQKLQKQIAHKMSSASGPLELEGRIQALTESLIVKQSTIESLKSDKHTLQVQLEKSQEKYKESQHMLNKETRVNVNTDEVRQRLPLFLEESPFDGNVARRVKYAYGCLDRFSIRLGIFLRRYPISRVFILFYMGLLHVWVMIVLVTYKPEIHDDYQMNKSLSHTK